MSHQNKFKKDRYAKARGGNSQFINLYCSGCGEFLVLYQKDGPGQLLRMYLDRIFAPQEFVSLQSVAKNKSDMSNLKCVECDALIGVPMVYEKEQRLAIRLVQGTFIKRKSDGVFPSLNQIKDVQNAKKGESDENGN